MRHIMFIEIVMTILRRTKRYLLLSLAGLISFTSSSFAEQTSGGVNWLDPLLYQKPAFVPISVPDEAQVANKYYVDMSSGAGSTCSATSPCSSIADLIGKPGTTGGPAYIYVRGRGTLSLYEATFYGSAGNEIVIKPWGNATATFDGGSNTNSDNVHHLIFDGGPNLSLIFLANVSNRFALAVESDHTTLYRTRSSCTDVAAHGLFGAGAWHKIIGARFINNEAYGCIGTGDQASFIYAGPGTPNGGYQDMLIQNNIIREMGGEGIEINPRVTSSNLEISGNAIHNVGKVTCSTAWGCRPGITMSVQSGDGNNGTVIKNNLIWDTGSSCVWDRGGGTPVPVIANNTCYDYAKVGTDPWPHGIAGYQGPGTAIVSNNIIYAPNGTDPLDGAYAGSNNLCGSGKSCGPASQIWNGTTVLGTNPNTSDFLKIGSSSNAVNHGVTLGSVGNDYANNLRPSGAAADVGAFEYVEASGIAAPKNLKKVVP